MTEGMGMPARRIRPSSFARAHGTNPDIETRMSTNNPSGRIGEPEDIAEAVIWFSSDAVSFIVGHTLAVDGGILAQ